MPDHDTCRIRFAKLGRGVVRLTGMLARQALPHPLRGAALQLLRCAAWAGVAMLLILVLLPEAARAAAAG